MPFSSQFSTEKQEIVDTVTLWGHHMPSVNNPGLLILVRRCTMMTLSSHFKISAFGTRYIVTWEAGGTTPGIAVKTVSLSISSVFPGLFPTTGSYSENNRCGRPGNLNHRSQHADGIDFTPGVKIQAILEYLHKTLACESAIFMYKPEAVSPRSPNLRAFWQFEICRRFDTERRCSGHHACVQPFR